jgi:hypothetical protein
MGEPDGNPLSQNIIKEQGILSEVLLQSLISYCQSLCAPRACAKQVCHRDPSLPTYTQRCLQLPASDIESTSIVACYIHAFCVVCLGMH